MTSTPWNNDKAFSSNEEEYIRNTTRDLSHSLQGAGIVWPTHEIGKFICKHFELLREPKGVSGNKGTLTRRVTVEIPDSGKCADCDFENYDGYACWCKLFHERLGTEPLPQCVSLRKEQQ